MVNARPGLGAITVFVDDVDGVASFYRETLEFQLVNRDEVSAAFDLGGTVINLLAVSAAPALTEPGPVASTADAAQMLLSLWVDDVDAVHSDLQGHGVVFLNGPLGRPWGKRTAAFRDPANITWEIAQDHPCTAGKLTRRGHSTLAHGDSVRD